MIKALILMVFIWLTAILQISLFRGLGWMSEFNPILLIVIWVALFASIKLGVPVIIFAGAALDSASYLPLGTYIVCLTAVWLAVRAMERGNFASLSLMSVTIMTVASVLVFEIMAIGLSLVLSGFTPDLPVIAFNLPALKAIGYSMLINGIVMAVFFSLASRASKRFNLSFISQYKRLA